MRRPRHALHIALLALVPAACFVPRSAYIDVLVVNAGEREYDEVVVSCDQCDSPMLANPQPGGIHTRLMALTKMPRRVEVSFEEQGREQRVELSVPDTRELRSDRSLEIIFRDGRDPTVRVRGRTRSGHTMSLPPVDPSALSPRGRLFGELQQAVKRRDSAAVARLLEDGAPLTHEGFSVLHLATRPGDISALSALLAKPLDVPSRHVLDAIASAALYDNVPALRLLRDRGAWPAAPESLWAALRNSVDHGSGEGLRWFVEEAGIPVNTPLTDMGHTMLDVAVQGTAVRVPALRARAEARAAYLRSKGGVQVVTRGR